MNVSLEHHECLSSAPLAVVSLELHNVLGGMSLLSAKPARPGSNDRKAYKGKKIGSGCNFETYPDMPCMAWCNAGGDHAASMLSMVLRPPAVQVLQPSTVHTRPALTTEHSPARWPAGQRAASPYQEEKLAIATVKGPDL